MKILGIDPGYAIVGWALIEYKNNSPQLIKCGVIETDKSLTIPERLDEIYNDLQTIINENRPEMAGIESLMFYNNAKTAIAVSEARGVINLAIHKAGIPIKHVTPLQVKNAVSGYGKATKKQVQESVKLLCGLKSVPKPDDAADAVAVAICAANL
ncbi:MAG: crossover junction endodeoxyribonuclease RuvC [Candidatus Dojkabacteria bacterium]